MFTITWPTLYISWVKSLIQFNITSRLPRSTQRKVKASITQAMPYQQSRISLELFLHIRVKFHVQVNFLIGASTLDPKNEGTLYNLGNAYYMVGKLQDALAQYEKALLINKKNAETHYNMGTAYKDINIPSKALTHLSRSLELDSKNLDTYIQIAIVCEIQKKYELAFRH